MSEWKPISSAPKGKRLLLYYPPKKSGRLTLPETIEVGFPGQWPMRQETHYQDLPAPPTDTHG